jgi:hypothetical protein
MNKTKHKQPEILPHDPFDSFLTDDESLEHDFMVEMFGEEDAAYFHYAGIDDIGSK